MIRRYVERSIREDLPHKMVFVAGARQVGKTTLARSLVSDQAGYLNWDIPEDREAILERRLPPSPLLVLDEIHKYRFWRNYLKGLFDRQGGETAILVTGSARLDWYRYGGDSLQGRFFFHRLHPFSVAELGMQTNDDMQTLLRLGGFPEPFLSGSERYARRWSREYRTQLIHEEVTSLERITDLGNLELLALRLPRLVGAPLSTNALREDLQLSHDTVSRWIAVFERLYAIVRLAPFGAPRIRAVKKARKHYHYDWTVVPELPQRFENMTALHLLKWVHYLQDSEGREVELRYFRDVDGREVDFVITENDEPILLVEAKWSDTAVDKGLRYLHRKFPRARVWQISATGSRDYLGGEGIRVAPALTFLRTLV